ncbi:MAG: ATP synthase subunit I [Rickettsiales bacterium]|jgi:hypothetical protein|nr:ATP synthase subunit I [Rickettsiales bacterium]
MQNAYLLVLIGFIIGVINNFLIKKTIRKLLEYKKVFVVVLSFILRFLLIGIIFYIFLNNNYWNAILMVIGFTLANFLFIWIDAYKGRKDIIKK